MNDFTIKQVLDLTKKCECPKPLLRSQHNKGCGFSQSGIADILGLTQADVATIQISAKRG